MSNKISRRAFLKCAGVSAAAVGSASLLSGCKTNGRNTTVNDVKVGDTVTLTIYRDGKTFDVDVKLVDTNDIS